MNPFVSVITCTHNPRSSYLERVLNALKSQTLPLARWEFLLIDNASDYPLANEIDLSWHRTARIVREEKLGLTPARLRGIAEANGELLVFVDDDNVLAADYLTTAFRIAHKYPMLGAWGSGAIEAQFEIEPPPVLQPHLGSLAVGVASKDAWSNASYNNHALPCGAGMCVRRQVAVTYAQQVSVQPGRELLDRRGISLSSCGDEDLAMTACDLGLGTACLISLQLTHLIPKERLTEEYFLKLHKGFGYSKLILYFLRNIPCYKRTLPRLLLNRYHSFSKTDFSSRLNRAWQLGEAEAWRDIDRFQKNQGAAGFEMVTSRG